MKTLISLLRNYCTHQNGAVMPLIGLTLTLLVGVTGVAIDMERAQNVKSRLSSSLDAAGLAAGSTISTVNLQQEVTKYLNANFQGAQGATITNVTATANSDNTVISISATAEVPSTLLKVLLIDSTTVNATSEIIRASKGLELAMVLDNTGSMGGSKLTNLKSAATDLVNILYGEKSSIPNLYIGLVPFAQSVNVGSGRSSWTDNASLDWGTTSWDGCVEARVSGNEDITDTPPTTAPFAKYYAECDRDYNGWFGTNSSRSNCSRVGQERYRSDIGLYRGPNRYCSQPVTAMTSSKSTIINAVNNMQAAGNTHINLGAVWGWRMLSPRWRNLWGGEMDSRALPLDYNSENMNKAAIIMTDGDNTMSTGVYSAYGNLSDGRLGTTNSGTARTRLDQRLGQVCTAMKNNNIIVYTISFGNISTSSQNMMRNCASQADFYFNSPSNAELQQAFRAIGDSLASLRVSR